MVRYTLLLYILITSTITDHKYHKIKNKYLMPAIIIGIIYNAISNGTGGLFSSLIGLFIPIICLFPLFIVRMLPAGDIKLVAAIGAIMGIYFSVNSFCYGIFIAGFWSLLLMFKNKMMKERIRYFITYIKTFFYSQANIQYNDYLKKDSRYQFPLAYFISSGVILHILLLNMFGYSLI